MTEDKASKYRTILARQLAMNEQTWATLTQHGVTEATPLRLDFTFIAPDQRSAAALRATLAETTDYDVKVQSSGGFLRKQWSVTGSTQPTELSPAILDQWVDWMVTAGIHDNCEFDGWGTQI
jgi:hypothetical protein